MSADFRRQLNKAYEEKVLGTQEKVTRLIALKVFNNIVENTPVDTGRARANWNIDLNTVDVSLVDPSGMEGGSYDGTEKALPVIGSYKLNDTIYISNNLPYIRPLNDGSSTKAPAGFVDAAVQIGVRQGKELAKQS
ncbi:HK97 gp10 family phage protein [Micavibrio aeruginosavorus]|uniref:HK97 gp10 family phage protein n=1 Tax=Micavibrio aeruginosavorus (strain ARL-13) TaxID=856793 RepID=G2KMV8_MICAA|nr:HK97 gp10 family phage protein [Micavibrio aeruginosavorus]AEP08890.1 putative uncharacterized protein [Micavibrio aeruginosavorus ARL-13]